MALLRGGKSSAIRLGGVVSLPAVTVDIERFYFHSGFEVTTRLNTDAIRMHNAERDNQSGTGGDDSQPCHFLNYVFGHNIFLGT